MSVYSNWYPHDFDTGNDEKIIKLEMEHGLEGSGLYHRILEHMGTSNNHSLDEDEINFIAKRNFSKIKNPVKVFLETGLFLQQKDGQIFSKSLRERLLKLDEKHNRRVVAGRKGGNQKASNAKATLRDSYKQKDSNALPLHNSTVHNKTEHNTKRKPSEKAIQLSRYLFDKMLINNPVAKEPNFDTWGKHIDLMLKIDKRTEEQIRYIIDFSQRDDFWKQNILSTAKLRKQFDALIVKVKTKPKKPHKTQQEKNEEVFAQMYKEIEQEEQNEKNDNKSDAIIVSRV